MWWKKKTKSIEEDWKPHDLISSMREVVEKYNLDINQLKLALPVSDDGKLVIKDRRRIILDSNGSISEWHIDSLESLYRGDKEAPDMTQYPAEYSYLFYTIESNVLIAYDFENNIIDDEFEHLYSTMKRRPDGKSESVMHDVIYQSAAFMLGIQSLSQSEYEGIFGQLARSVRFWKEGEVSRNYINYLKKSFKES